MSNRRLFILLTFIYILTIYGTSGRARDVSILVRQQVGDALSFLVTAGLILILSGVLFLFRHSISRRNILPLCPVIIGYGICLWWLKIPEERFHLLQYGLLTALCIKALPDRIRGISRSVLAVTLVAGVGIGDELIQWLRPNRVGDVRDVLINAVAALLAQALITAINGTHSEKETNNQADEQKW
jgi:hypothetical protein